MIKLEGLHVFGIESAPPVGGLTAPRWCRLFPGPTVRHRPDFPDEGIAFNDSLFDEFVAGWKAIGAVPLPVDYAHHEDGIAAGWIVDMRKDGVGNFEVAIEWTARAKAAIEASELRYLSPTFAMDHTNPLTGLSMGATLFGAGLLNTPFLHDLPAVTASKRGNAKVTTSEFMKKVCAIFGLAEDMGEVECLSYLTEKAKPAEMKKEEPAVDPYDVAAKQASAVAEAIELTSAPLKTSLAKLEAEKAKLETEKTELSARVSVLEQEKVAAGIAELVRVSLARGVANASERVEKALRLGGNLDSARDIMSMVEPTVVVGELGHGGADEAPETRETAFVKLKAIADTIEAAEKARPGKAFELAIIRNPKLAAATRGQ